MSGWGCPHELNGKCQRLKGRDCDPGMKGCLLFGRFRFINPAKNRPSRDKREDANAGGGTGVEPPRKKGS